jgi:hypothetical protein
MHVKKYGALAEKHTGTPSACGCGCMWMGVGAVAVVELGLKRG